MSEAPAQNPPAQGTEKSSNFFLGFLFLPKAKREALSAVYAYCRLIDDIVDDGTLPKEEAEAGLRFWREEIGRLFAGAPTHPVSRRLLAPVKDFGLPQDPFLEMIRGCAMDLEKKSYASFSDLESYMRGVACSVGELAVRIFGCRHTREADLKEYARLFGFAFQLTNILRDVGADLEMGRIYLPEDDMKEAGYSREELLRREPTPAFERLMEKEAARAAAFYRQARNLVDFRDRPSLVSAEVMARIYEKILAEMRRDGFKVLFKRYRVSSPGKIACAMDAWLYCHGIHL